MLCSYHQIISTIHSFLVVNKYESIRAKEETMDDYRFVELCDNGDVEGVRAAIDNGADINEEDDWGELD